MLLRAKDQTGATISKFKSSISGLKLAVGGLAGAFAIRELIDNINEAEQATAQLDSAFKATGSNARVTRKELDDLATSIQKTTTYSDDLVKQAESILLTFRQVRGDAFERTIKVSTDLAERLGVDLVSAVRQVGRAINDPVQGLSLLRRSGIQFTDSQTELIKRLVETGDAARAQNLILSELENRYKGAAAAARNTLAGSLAGLKNAFGDLFEGSKAGTAGITDAINGLSKSLSDPNLKAGVETLVNGFLMLLTPVIKVAAAIGATATALKEIANNKIVQGTLRGLATMGGLPGLAASGILAATADNKKPPIGGVGHGGSRIPNAESFDTIPAIPKIEEFTVTVKKIKDDYKGILDDLEESTRTSSEKMAEDFIKLRTNLEFLRDEKLITGDQFAERLKAAQDELLPEFDLNEIKAKYASVKAETTELGEFMKGVWQGVGKSIQGALSDVIYEWKFSFKSIIDITRRALADILSAIVVSGIQKAIKAQIDGIKSGTGGGFWAGLLKAFGFAAGGGKQSGPRIVGEDGPELDMGGGRIYNRRQMAFAGMGGNISYSPTTNISVLHSDDPDKMRRELLQAVAIQNAQQQKELVRTLQRNNVDVK